MHCNVINSGAYFIFLSSIAKCQVEFGHHLQNWPSHALLSSHGGRRPRCKWAHAECLTSTSGERSRFAGTPASTEGTLKNAKLGDRQATIPALIGTRGWDHRLGVKAQARTVIFVPEPSAQKLEKDHNTPQSAI